LNIVFALLGEKVDGLRPTASNLHDQVSGHCPSINLELPLSDKLLLEEGHLLLGVCIGGDSNASRPKIQQNEGKRRRVLPIRLP